MMEMLEEKIYFMPGDMVTLKQELPFKPTMLVVGKKTAVFRPKALGIDNKEEFLKGIICRWFTTDLTLQEAVFNTKDLLKVEI